MNRLLQIFFAIGLPAVFISYHCSEKKIIDSRFSFTKNVVAQALGEPMQMGELPDGTIMFIERHGNIKIFDPESRVLTLADHLPVLDTLEDGLLGLAIDPKWTENHWIYLYYSPVSTEQVNRLSRFVFQNGKLDPASEKVLLQVNVQRQECCHSGGGLHFSADGFLYLGIGDNTNPIDDYTSIDERPGRGPWDSQKSSANTMDLRGKILRIKPLPDGSYVCPAGNLFVQEDVHVTPPTENTPAATAPDSLPAANQPPATGRPEIYIMGCRNPFRLTVDAQRKLLLWADVGPDASNPDSLRGPMGYDEFNRAATAGNYGWPYFIADNKPFRDFDFATGKAGAWFDPAHPVNESPNNTGARELPPAQPAMIWYGYGPSAEFPTLEDGGRSAMAGPVYHAGLYPEESRLPDYYDGKWFIYDWMRSWIMVVDLDTAGNYAGLERFAPDLTFTCPVDMLLDKKGRIWVLDYGTNKYSDNPDACLSRIDLIRENRAPQPRLQADQTAGAAPLQVVFSVAGTRDPEGDALQYEFDFGDDTPLYRLENEKPAGSEKENQLSSVDPASATGDAKTAPRPDSIVHVFRNTGTYEVTLKVTDAQGKWDTTKMLIHVGNAAPFVDWDLGGRNRSFYRSGDVLHYRIIVDDPEEGTLANTGIAAATVSTSVDYLESGFDITALSRKPTDDGQQAEYARGKILIDRADCKSCHAVDRLVNGPAFQSVAERYRKDPAAVRRLAGKVIHGGGGNWGQTLMMPHPQLSEADASEMVRWILSLGAAPAAKQSLPVSGHYTLAARQNPGTFILKASYRDKGAKGQGPLAGSAVLALRPALQQAEQADSISASAAVEHPFDDNRAVLGNLLNNQFFCFRHVDLAGLQTISLLIGLGGPQATYVGGSIELRLDSRNGPVVGTLDVPAAGAVPQMQFLEKLLILPTTSDGQFHDLYFVFKNEQEPLKPVAAVDWVRFNLAASGGKPDM